MTTSDCDLLPCPYYSSPFWGEVQETPQRRVLIFIVSRRNQSQFQNVLQMLGQNEWHLCTGQKTRVIYQGLKHQWMRHGGRTRAAKPLFYACVVVRLLRLEYETVLSGGVMSLVEVASIRCEVYGVKGEAGRPKTAIRKSEQGM